ncbi:biotin/lipoyl-binding protein [Nocardioides sp. L-11A]|uniref:HlyD family efflux transporter periplasmic adaptor subunit n=1 Tax=Nocardioides sp. L-11A TaxID=3043848 RepID=UPI00249CDE77|nr:biotin/lipoyl-binding protein [Nocardioides sp. L-11A]
MRTLNRPRRLVVPLALLAVAGTGLAAYGAVAGDPVRYRTVQAAVGDVEQVLDLTGVVAATGRADLSFGTAGEVSRVPVAVGDRVEPGDVIAVLDRASLRAAVDRARADLASAKAQLADDRDAQTAAVATTATTAATTGTGPTPGAVTSKESKAAAPAATPDLGALTAQQDAVLAAQTSASTALATSTTALRTQQAACVATEAPVATETPADATAPADESAADPTDDACAEALAIVQSTQAATAAAQDALQRALSTLATTLTAALGDLTVGAGNAGNAGNAPSSTAAPSTADSGSPTPGGSSRTVTAATLAEDQAAIDRARADLTSARADLRAAVVRAPAGGTVSALSVAPGDDVAAGAAAAVVVAPGVTTVALEATESQAAQLAVGTPVAATPAGAGKSLSGVVGRVARVPTSSTDPGAEPTYRVEVALDRHDLTLPDGLPAAVEVVVARAADAVTVPASAVTDGTVTTLVDGAVRQVRVTTGIVGGTAVEILDGVDAGTEIVLADLDADLPSGDGQDQGPGGFGGGGLGGLGGGVRMGPPGGGITVRR